MPVIIQGNFGLRLRAVHHPAPLDPLARWSQPDKDTAIRLIKINLLHSRWDTQLNAPIAAPLDQEVLRKAEIATLLDTKKRAFYEVVTKDLNKRSHEFWMNELRNLAQNISPQDLISRIKGKVNEKRESIKVKEKDLTKDISSWTTSIGAGAIQLIQLFPGSELGVLGSQTTNQMADRAGLPPVPPLIEKIATLTPAILTTAIEAVYYQSTYGLLKVGSHYITPGITRLFEVGKRWDMDELAVIQHLSKLDTLTEYLCHLTQGTLTLGVGLYPMAAVTVGYIGGKSAKTTTSTVLSYFPNTPILLKHIAESTSFNLGQSYATTWLPAPQQSQLSKEDAAEFLGLNPETATKSQINQKYRALSQKYHPDKTSNSSSAEFLKLQQSREILLANIKAM
jgi:hypothetical protein